MMRMAHFMDLVGLAAYGVSSRAASCEVRCVLELHPCHPGHQGFVRILLSPSAGGYYFQVFPQVTRAACRRMALWIAWNLDVASVGAMAAASPVACVNYAFVLSQYVQHPGHRGGLRWPRRRVTTALQVWRESVGDVTECEHQASAIGSSAVYFVDPEGRRVRPRVV